MKDRRKLRIIDGLRQSPGKLAYQRAALALGITRESDQSLSCALHEEVEQSLATALKASERRLSALLHDRSRIGRELHESVLQALYAIGLTLEQTPGLREKTPIAVSCFRDQAADQLHQLIQDIRRMILSVESDRVDPFRLITELQVLAKTVERVSKLQIHVEVEPAAEEILTGEEARELVTIAREALSNCVRYARATRIVIVLRRIGSRVQLCINDDGSGFDIEREPAKGIVFAHMEGSGSKDRWSLGYPIQSRSRYLHHR